MARKRFLFFIGAGVIIILMTITIAFGLLKNRPVGKDIAISYSYCLDIAQGLTVAEQDTVYRKTYYKYFLIDSFAHYYVKTIIFQKDTFSISTLNYANKKEALAKATAASGHVTGKKPEGFDGKGLALFSSKQGKYLSRFLLPDRKFNTITVLDHFGNDSLKVRRIFEEEPLLKLVSKCH